MSNTSFSHYLRTTKMFLNELDKLTIFEVNELLNEVSNQNIPDYIADNAAKIGLSNFDYITSEYLINKGYKNGLQ